MSKMLCIDHFLRDKSFPHFKKRFENATIIDCSSVAEFYYELSSRDDWDLDDMHTIAPPFERCWLDFTHPKYILTEEGMLPWLKHFPVQWGFDMSWYESTHENLDYITSKLPLLWEDSMPIMKEWLQTSKWFLDIYFWWKTAQGGNYGPIWAWRLFLDEDGKVSKHEGTKTNIIEGPVHSAIFNAIDRMAEDKNLTHEQARESVYGQMSGFMLAALLSINFFHCRNVKLENVDPPRPKPLNNAQRRRGETREPFVKHKVLNIVPMKKVLTNVEHEQGVGSKRAFHICAGHFATYTEEKPLFGKITGTFFIPQHTRGSLEVGKIEKDYKITVKSENIKR